MEFWRDPDAERRQEVERKREEVMEFLANPFARRCLHGLLDYLEAHRTNERMRRADFENEGFLTAMRLIRDCGNDATKRQREDN
jgi:hypothetical protein